MKILARTIAVVAALLSVLSCRMDFLYIQLPGTSWSIEVDDQRAFVHFEEDRATLIQRNATLGAVKMANGSYTTDGHSIIIALDNGGTQKMIRTFSHLKNGNNKNYSSLSPESCELENTVWHTIYKDSLRVLYFHDGQVHHYSFANLSHKEGIPYGWKHSQASYTVAGNQVSLGGELNATLFPEVMLVGDHWYMHFPVLEDTGCSNMVGGFWPLQSGGYPGGILFDSYSTFTRILVSAADVYQAQRGTYSREGDVLSMQLEEAADICTVQDDSFTFLERTYEIYE